MDVHYQFSNQLSSRSFEFLKKNCFTDCILIDDTIEYKLHRVILAKGSIWFNSYFHEHPKTGIRVPIPFNYHNVFQHVIDFLYCQPISINVDNAVPLLKASIVYGISSLEQQVCKFLEKQPNTTFDSSFLKIVKQLVELDLSTKVIEIPEYVRHLAIVLNKSKTDTLKKQLYESLSPLILAQIFKQYRFPLSASDLGESSTIKNPQSNIVRFDKIEWIENFVNYYIAKKMASDSTLTDSSNVLTYEEKQALENCVHFTEEKQQSRLFLQYKCDWVTPETAIQNLNQIINNRRKSLESFENEINNNPGISEVSHMYPLIWATTIAQSVVADRSPQTHVISFFNDLGQLSSNQGEYINPCKYGFVRIDATPQFCNSQNYKPSNAVWMKPDCYYLSEDMTYQTKEANPYFSVSFSPNSRFILSQIQVESDIPRPKSTDRRFPSALEVRAQAQNDLNEKPICNNITFREGRGKQAVTSTTPIYGVKFIMSGEEDMGGRMLRIKYVDLVGHFLP